MLNSKRPSNLVMSALAIGLAVWCMAAPRPYVPAVMACVLAPWAGLAAVFLSGGRLVLNGRDSETRPDVFNLIFIPALAAGARALIDFSLLDWQMALAAAVGVSIVWNAVILLARRGERPKGFVVTSVLLLLFGVDFGYGVVTFADVLGDKAQIASYTPQVTGKRVSHGKGTTYYLGLTGWGGKPADEDSVSQSLYNRVSAGDRVCVFVHPGRLGLKWYEIAGCEPS